MRPTSLRNYDRKGEPSSGSAPPFLSVSCTRVTAPSSRSIRILKLSFKTAAGSVPRSCARASASRKCKCRRCSTGDAATCRGTMRGRGGSSRRARRAGGGGLLVLAAPRAQHAEQEGSAQRRLQRDVRSPGSDCSAQTRRASCRRRSDAASSSSSCSRAALSAARSRFASLASESLRRASAPWVDRSCRRSSCSSSSSLSDDSSSCCAVRKWFAAGRTYTVWHIAQTSTGAATHSSAGQPRMTHICASAARGSLSE